MSGTPRPHQMLFLGWWCSARNFLQLSSVPACSGAFCLNFHFLRVKYGSVGFRSGDWLGHGGTFHFIALRKSLGLITASMEEFHWQPYFPMAWPGVYASDHEMFLAFSVLFSSHHSFPSWYFSNLFLASSDLVFLVLRLNSDFVVNLLWWSLLLIGFDISSSGFSSQQKEFSIHVFQDSVLLTLSSPGRLMRVDLMFLLSDEFI